MDPAKKKRLQDKGWKVGSADEVLELSPQETALVDVRLKLADAVKLLRKGLTDWREIGELP